MYSVFSALVDPESILGDKIDQELKYSGKKPVIEEDKLMNGFESYEEAIRYANLNTKLNIKKVFPQIRLGEFETKTDGYIVLDITGSYTIRLSKLSHKFIFQIDNVSNEVYYNHLSRIKSVMPEKRQSISIQYRLTL